MGVKKFRRDFPTTKRARSQEKKLIISSFFSAGSLDRFAKYDIIFTLTKRTENEMDKKVKSMMKIVEVAAEGATGNERAAMMDLLDWVVSGQAAREGDCWRTMRVVSESVGVLSSDPAVREAVGAWNWNVDWREVESLGPRSKWRVQG